MIRAHWALLAFAACMALTAFPVKADVMEINSEGARWIAGAHATDAAFPNSISSDMAAIADVPAEIYVPDNIVGDPSRHAARVPYAYRVKVAELSARFDLSPSLIEAMVWQESRWRHDARSPAGAQGLAQLMPGTARELGVDPSDPFANLEGGARYLRQQLDRFDGDLEKALAAYNAGPGRVERANGIPRIRETQLYVASILGRLADHSRE